MARRLRIAALSSLAVTAFIAALLGGAYYAARQVQPFYEQALQIEPEVLERGSRELESQATALYSDARRAGQWHALFTDEQINGWLAIQLAEERAGELSGKLRDPRVAIAADRLTLGFRTRSGGVNTVVSVDASAFLTEDGAVAIRLMSVRAGALPLPVMQLADELASVCQGLSLPVRWSQQDGQPVAIVEIHSESSTNKRQFHIDTIELREGELYVAGHTELGNPLGQATERDGAQRNNVELTEYELRLTPRHERSALEIARRPDRHLSEDAKDSDR